jgi:DNA (cytosine-5)-methyltransferase 1
MKNYLSIIKAAQFLGVTPQTLRNWDKQGKFSPYRNPMNNYRMYKKAELERLLKKVRKK